ncbi:carboxymuconolactone decarboxylase family protein [Massilibacteroides sp.]|uniref:carboxymuconolactone decarboxylase family protein n=1 Tax=Massilibacteroides sp. TaxID=2034766 RepID=UPI00261D219E|nr:carboxymuconolactone decarboxylase family protein [Massilibacteroides sp.]MDD4515859.1 carboxymuconolactone decarboxylase family protein [Massilibacteroides sp.]
MTKHKMSENENIPSTITQRERYKHKYNLVEMYRVFIKIPDALSKFIKNKKAKTVNPQFIERLQLAVTEVNGCAVCSFVHAQLALKEGMNNDEIFSFLNGDNKFVKPQEAKAILFAQHYADSEGFPNQSSFDAIVVEYGEEKAGIMLAAIQLMMAGNVYGIPQSAFKSRLNGKKYKDSSLFYELSMQIVGILFLPLALLHGWLKKLLGFKMQKFKPE